MIQKKKIILIGKCYENDMSGPANIIRELIKNFEREEANYTAIIMNEKTFWGDFVYKVIKTILKEKQAVVNVHTDGFFIPLIVYIISFLNSFNYYYLTVHGIYQIEAEKTQQGYKKYVFIERFLYTKFQYLICVSQMLKNDMKKYFGRTDNILVIPNGTDAYSECQYSSSSRENALEIISMGGLRKRKGIDEIIQLAIYLRKSSMLFHISIYGIDEDREKEFNSTILKESLSGMVEYYGNITDKQKVYDIITTADFQLCLSKYDTYNVAIAESLVLGCPVIVTNNCGASYLVENWKTGLIIDLDDVEKYEKILEYINSFTHDTNRRFEIYKNKERFVHELSWKTIINQYLSLGDEK